LRLNGLKRGPRTFIPSKQLCGPRLFASPMAPVAKPGGWSEKIALHLAAMRAAHRGQRPQAGREVMGALQPSCC